MATNGSTVSAGAGANQSAVPQPRSRGSDGNKNKGKGRGGRGRGRGDGQRGGGGAGRGRGRGDTSSNDAALAAAGDAVQTDSTTVANEKSLLPQDGAPTAGEGGQPTDDDGEEVCFICANPVIHHSIPPCNHLTCHICSLRMRALYKNKDCPHCRTAAPFVIFNDNAEKRFEEYTEADISSSDQNIGIKYTNEDIVGDTILLLRYNCPDASCDYAGHGWPDLHRHVRSVHRKKMCDLCTRNKKVFTHEHELFADKELERHMRHGDDKPGALDQTGFKGHPLCGFCGERFYDDDKLYEHCRNKHERCFICDRRDSRTPHYYQNYDALEGHFRKDHFPCLDRDCQEQKFVVFESEMDLKAHQLEQHGETLSKDVRRDARVVDMSGFNFRTNYQEERRGGRGGRRGRDPNAEALPPSSAQPLRRDELAFQRQMAIHSAQSVSNRTFGGQLTSTAAPTPAQASGSARPTTTSAQTQPLADSMDNLNVADAANMTPQERAKLVRHSSVIERASNLLGNDGSKMNTFRSDISKYRTGAFTAPQLIDSFFALFSDTSSHALATLVREVADLFEDKGKAEGLRKAWQDWRAINEDYPSLPGLGGMHGAATSSSGWANAAAASPGALANASASQRHTNRVLKLKSSTRRASNASVSSSGSGVAARIVPGANWVAPRSATSNNNNSSNKTNSSPAFPALPSSGTTRQTTASWIGGSGASTPLARSARASPAPAAMRRPGPGEDAFPALPAAPKPLTTIFGYGRGAVRRDLGGSSSSNSFSWGGGAAATSATSASADPTPGEADGTGKGKKKGKQAKKQVLVQWG